MFKCIYKWIKRFKRLEMDSISFIDIIDHINHGYPNFPLNKSEYISGSYGYIIKNEKNNFKKT
jgi:hypothetical protein